MPSPAPTYSSFGSLAAQAAPPDRRQPGGAPARVRRLKVRRAMQVLGTPLTLPNGQPGAGDGESPGPASLPGRVTHGRDLQILFSNESVAQALGQLDVYGTQGLPVLSPDGQRIEGCVTNASVLQCVACRIDASWQQAREAELAAEWARGDPGSGLREPPTPLYGHHVVEVAIPGVPPRWACRWEPSHGPTDGPRFRRPAAASPGVEPGAHYRRRGPHQPPCLLPLEAATARDPHAVRDPGALPDEALPAAGSRCS